MDLRLQKKSFTEKKSWRDGSAVVSKLLSQKTKIWLSTPTLGSPQLPVTSSRGSNSSF